MLGAVYLQTPDKRLLKIQYFINFNVEYRCLRILGHLTLETRFLRADLIEVFKILRGFENLDPDRFFQVIGDGARRGTVLNCSRSRFRRRPMLTGCIASTITASPLSWMSMLH